MDRTFADFTTTVLGSLEDYWEAFLLTLPKLLVALILLMLIAFIGVRISRFFKRRLSVKANDALFSSFIAQLIKYVFFIVAVMVALQVLGLSGLAGGLLAGAGVSALIFGFAFKDIGENFLAGIILAFDRPFNIHDTIKVSEFMGRVEALNFRTTHIKTFDEKDVFIPNFTIVKEVLTNLTRDGNLRIDFVIGIAYEDNLQQAVELIVDQVKEYSIILPEPEPFAVVEEFSVSTVNIRIFFWTSTDDYRRGVLVMKSEIMARVKKALLAAGFTLPAYVIDLKLYDQRNPIPVLLTDIDSTNRQDPG